MPYVKRKVNNHLERVLYKYQNRRIIINNRINRITFQKKTNKKILKFQTNYNKVSS